MENQFILGQTVDIAWIVTVGGVATDVASNTLTIITPTGALPPITGTNIAHTGTGTYSYNYKPAVARASEGTYTWRAESTSPDGAFEGWFTFVPSPFF